MMQQVKLECKNCKQEHIVVLKPKIVPTHIKVTDVRIPKYTVMINASCLKCSKHIKFIKQDEETVKATNEWIELFYQKTIDK